VVSNFWFKPKTHGYGATPANWKGWAATLAFVAVLLALSLLCFAWQPGSLSRPAAWHISIWAGLTAVLTIGFVWLCRAKSDGQWGWRWGK
jgi:hypothetical protein